MRTDAKKKILIAEDDEFFRDALMSVLSDYDDVYSCHLAEDGKVALQMIQADHFDLLVSDIRMPKLNGIELLKWIRKEKPAIKVILMTGFSSQASIEEANALGVDGLFEKPFNIENFLCTISSILGVSTDTEFGEPVIQST